MTKMLITLFIGVVLLTTAACTSAASIVQPEVPDPDETQDTLVDPIELDEMQVRPADIIELDEEDATTIRVLWTVADVVASKDFQGDNWSPESYIFSPLDINETQIIFNGQMCDGVVFTEMIIDISAYLADTWGESAKSLGIEGIEEIQVVKTNCSLFGFAEYMRLGDGRLVVPYQGVFFFFEPAFDR